MRIGLSRVVFGALVMSMAACSAAPDQLQKLAGADPEPAEEASIDDFVAPEGNSGGGSGGNAVPNEACDAGIGQDSSAALDAARAIELCRMADDDGYGVVSAAFVRANGSAASSSRQNAVMPSFGPNVAPRAGERILVLSSGAARLASDPQACGQPSCEGTGLGQAPAGFPQDVPNCTGSSDINDDIALEVTLGTPDGATGYAFDFNFYTHEYPEYVCTEFNDQFVALASPAPSGAINGNISFDSKSNPVSVNIAFFDVCDGCAQGTDAMQGTGFDSWGNGPADAGATGWLTTEAPLDGAETITIRFAIWDTGDTALDSTVLIDNFRWIDGEVDVETVPVPK